MRSRTTSRAVAIATAMAAVAAIAGCGSSSSSTSTSGGAATSGGGSTSANAAKTKPNIAYLNFTINPYSQADVRGIKAGSGGKVTVFSSNFDPQKALSQCQDALNSGRYNVLVVGSPDGASAIPCARLAAAKKIPVIGDVYAISKNLDELNPSTPGVKGQVVTPPGSHVQIALKEIKDACAGANPCPVIYDIVNQFTPLSREFLAYIKAHPDQAGGIKIVGTYSGNYDPGQTQKNLPPVIRAHPNVKVVYSADDVSAPNVPQMLAAAGVKAKVVTDGYSSLAANAIKSGKVYSSIVELPYTGGQKIGQMAAAAVNGQTIAQPGVDNLHLGPFTIVTKQNVDQLKTQY